MSSRQLIRQLIQQLAQLQLEYINKRLERRKYPI